MGGAGGGAGGGIRRGVQAGRGRRRRGRHAAARSAADPDRARGRWAAERARAARCRARRAPDRARGRSAVVAAAHESRHALLNGRLFPSPSPSHPPPLSTISLAAAARPANHAFARVGFRARHVHALPLGLRPSRPRRAGKVSAECVPHSLMPPYPTGRTRLGIPVRRPAPRGKPCDAARWGGRGNVRSAQRQPARDQSRQ